MLSVCPIPSVAGDLRLSRVLLRPLDFFTALEEMPHLQEVPRLTYCTLLGRLEAVSLPVLQLERSPTCDSTATTGTGDAPTAPCSDGAVLKAGEYGRGG